MSYAPDKEPPVGALKRIPLAGASSLNRRCIVYFPSAANHAYLFHSLSGGIERKGRKNIKPDAHAPIYTGYEVYQSLCTRLYTLLNYSKLHLIFYLFHTYDRSYANSVYC